MKQWAAEKEKMSYNLDSTEDKQTKDHEPFLKTPLSH